MIGKEIFEQEGSDSALLLVVVSSVGYDLVIVAVGPVGQGLQVGYQRRAHLSEGVFHAGRHHGIDLARDEVIGFQGAQARGEHARGDVGDVALQFAEAEGRWGAADDHQNDERPFVAEAADDVAKRTFGVGWR